MKQFRSSASALLASSLCALASIPAIGAEAPQPVDPAGPKPAQTTMMMRKADLSETQKPLWASKPDIAAFEKIDNDHLAAAERSIAALVAEKGPHTVDNTLRPLDDATREIDSALYFASLMESVHPDAKFRDHGTAMLRKASAAQTKLSLNRTVYQALAAVPLEGADAATQYYIRRQLLEFRLSGVDKDDATRAKLAQLNDQLTAESSAFARNINDGTKTIEVRGVSELAGMPQDFIDAHKPKDGVIRLTTDYTDSLPVLKFAASDDLRRRMLLAFDTRAYPKNREVLQSILETRHQIANLLGYKTWADYNAADKMIGSGAAIGKFIDDLEAAVRPTMEKEFQMLLAEKKKTQPQASTIGTWEWSHYQELVRRSSFDFDSQSVRPYFPYQQVKQGILDTASKLFHVSFRREDNVPAWEPSVETWLVLDGPKVIGRIYLDMHPRPGKYSHAEMAQVFDGQEGRQLPEAILICNFPRPTATDPGLMEYGDVQTFFHEFGHLMHMIIGGHQAWAGVSGITMEADFAEAPSQMLEELIASPQVLAGFARDYKTGKPIPTELVMRMRRASAFGRAIFVAQQDGYSA
ncbi:MAG TPA: M3 family metallopeptidase, partial [Steroidobacteraceae bacterium]|nr:M3 family metallopeptidase [Steroidobacteraceae bacterium]